MRRSRSWRMVMARGLRRRARARARRCGENRCVRAGSCWHPGRRRAVQAVGSSSQPPPAALHSACHARMHAAPLAEPTECTEPMPGLCPTADMGGSLTRMSSGRAAALVGSVRCASGARAVHLSRDNCFQGGDLGRHSECALRQVVPPARAAVDHRCSEPSAAMVTCQCRARRCCSGRATSPVYGHKAKFGQAAIRPLARGAPRDAVWAEPV
jgi:hypothetical protein